MNGLEATQQPFFSQKTEFLVSQKMPPFQVEGGNNWKFLHRQLLCALLVRVALAAPGFNQLYDVQTSQNSRIHGHNFSITHLILDMEPRCSAWVNLFRQKSKEIVEPSAIAGRSREMSQKGSIVVDTPLHTCEKVYKMIHTGMFSFCTPVKRFTICCIQECFFVANLTHNI